jgi:hypothetical protein
MRSFEVSAMDASPRKDDIKFMFPKVPTGAFTDHATGSNSAYCKRT